MEAPAASPQVCGRGFHFKWPDLEFASGLIRPVPPLDSTRKLGAALD
jgi:hypothetical protein